MTQNPGADVEVGHGDKTTSFPGSYLSIPAAANNKGSFLFLPFFSFPTTSILIPDCLSGLKNN